MYWAVSLLDVCSVIHLHECYILWKIKNPHELQRKGRLFRHESTLTLENFDSFVTVPCFSFMVGEIFLAAACLCPSDLGD